MTNDFSHWAGALYGVLATAAILTGGLLVGPARALTHGSPRVLAALGAGFLVALGGMGALPEALELSESPLAPIALAAAALGCMLWLHRIGHHGWTADGAHDHTPRPPERSAPEHGHQHGPHEPQAALTEQERSTLSLHDARMAATGLALHSLLDGVAVSAALASERSHGLFVAVFVLLHKLPEGAAAAAITYASGGDRAIARRAVFAVAAASLAGAFAIFVVEPVLPYALAITAGVTVGVGLGIASHLRGEHGSRQVLLGLLAGGGLFALTEWLLHA